MSNVFSRFRNLTPYTVTPEKGKRPPFKIMSALANDLYVFDDEGGIDEFKCHDPAGSTRETVGLFGLGGEYVRDIEGKGVLITLRFSKRNLPARVIKDRVDVMVEDHFKQTGVKVGRKQRREMSEDAEMALLPQAFISHVYIPVIFTSDNQLFIFSGAAKRIDTVLTFLVNFLSATAACVFSLTRPTQNINIGTETWMTSKAIGVFDEFGDIEVTNFAVMKADEHGKMRLSERSLTHTEVQEALKKGWRVNQIGLIHNPSGMTFRLDENFTIRAATMSVDAAIEFKESKDDGIDDVQAVAWLVTTEFRNIIDSLLADMRSAAPEEDEL